MDRAGGAGGRAGLRDQRAHLGDRLAAASPARFEPDLARSLGALGTHLRTNGKLTVAAEAFREGIEILKPHAERLRKGPSAQLLSNLENGLRQTVTGL